VTAKKMESEYKGLLEQAVQQPNTGTPWLPNMTELIVEQFNVLEEELKQEKELNQQLITDANAVVTKCNTDMQTRYAGPVTTKRNKVSAERTAHKECRTVETGDVSKRDVACLSPKYQNTDNPSSTDANIQHYTYHSQAEETQNVEICKANPDYYNNGDSQAWTGTATDFSTDLLTAIKQANECVGYLEQGKACDRQQRQFEADFCMYAQELRDTCKVHTSCYTQAVADRGVTVEDVTKLEAAQKMVWISLQKINCYVSKLSALEQSGTVPTSADIATCTALDPSTDPLNILKPAADPKDDCDESTVTHQPGDAQWKTDEYSSIAAPSPAAWKVDAGRSEKYSEYIEIEPVNGCTYHL